MLHDETRKLLISVNTNTVYRLEKQMRETATGQLKSNLSVFPPI